MLDGSIFENPSLQIMSQDLKQEGSKHGAAGPTGPLFI
jgi:hypothetical protein